MKSVFAKFAALALLALAAAPLAAQQVGFHDAIEQALKHNGNLKIAAADRARAADRYRAERANYYPTIVFGTNAGYSVGVAVSVAGQLPSLFNVSHSQTVFNLAEAEAIKALHSESRAASIEYGDRAEQVILDAALLYIELDSTEQRLQAVIAQKGLADRSLYIAQQRQQEGLANRLDAKRAELDVARVELAISELQASATVLRERLARMMGVPAATLETVSATIPAAPALAGADDVSSLALSNSNGVRAADERARAAHFRARAEHKVNLPSVDFAGQYAQLSPYLNYGLTNTPTQNYSFAFNIRIPIFNLAQNARAAAADAEALRAEAEAQNARDQVAAEAVRAQQAVRQLEAQAKVFRLEYEVAEANIDQVQMQIERGKANAHDQEVAKAELAGRRVVLLQSQFEYLRAQLQLLRQTGELRGWALGEKH